MNERVSEKKMGDKEEKLFNNENQSLLGDMETKWKNLAIEIISFLVCWENHLCRVCTSTYTV